MLVVAVVVEKVCAAALIPFKVYNPLLLQMALPAPSFVNTALVVVKLPPVTLKVLVTIDVDVKFPVNKLVELNVPLNILLPAIV